MKVLVACEFSGIVREAFKARGHDAWSCDLLPTEQPGQHIQGDVLEILDDGWDMMIAHPPCTYLAVSGACHFNRLGRKEKQDEALTFFRRMLDAPIPRVAVENPVGVTSTKIRKPDQWIQPYEHGHEAMKKTGLWLRNLPKLIPTNIVSKGPIWINRDGTRRGSRWHMCLPPTADRWKIRSRTFQGIANAMSEQWNF